MTHTVAKLDVTLRTFDEIKDRLERAAYQHTFMHDGCIDLTGIALAAKADQPTEPGATPAHRVSGDLQPISRAQPSDAARRAEEAIAQWHTDRFEILRSASMQQDHMLELQRIRGIQARVHLSSAATIRAREFPQPFQPSDAGSRAGEAVDTSNHPFFFHSAAVTLPRAIAEQVAEKLRVIAAAYKGDKQTRDTLLPALEAALAFSPASEPAR